jgi:hypothetical protein
MTAKTTFVLASALALSLAACSSDGSDLDSSLVISNESSYSFIEINLSPIDHVAWGADLLGTDILIPGEQLETSGIACGTYDIRVIDEDNDMCVLDTVDLCVDNAVWRIDDTELAGCQLTLRAH